MITLTEVKAAQRRYLTQMNHEIKGYQLDTCFAASGCPNRANESTGLVHQVEKIRKEADLFSFLKKHVSGPLKCHHEFRITFADCPNACSQPQIKDIGIIGASKPCVTDQECTHCDACTETCPDPAILLPHDRGPQIDDRRCLACGQCLMICPTGTLIESQKGFRIQLAGKLGRHPKLARELPSLYSKPEVLSIVTHCLDLYKKRRAGGQRFADFFTQPDRDQLIALFDRSS